MIDDNFSKETKGLIDQLDELLSGHKDCVDACKAEYTSCIAYCGDYVCRAKCRGSLESCINACSGLDMDSDTQAKMTSLLDKIEASVEASLSRSKSD